MGQVRVGTPTFARLHLHASYGWQGSELIACATTNAIHQSTSVKVDFFVAPGTPLDATSLQRRMGSHSI